MAGNVLLTCDAWNAPSDYFAYLGAGPAPVAAFWPRRCHCSHGIINGYNRPPDTRLLATERSKAFGGPSRFVLRPRCLGVIQSYPTLIRSR